MAANPIIGIHDRRSTRPWRGEPVIVGKFRNDQGKLEHRVVPAHKFASAGDTLVFKYYDCKIDIQGNIFGPPDYSIPNEVRATLKKDLLRGIHHYEVICNGKVKAKGASPPVVIIDP
jgi:hypothetical protein